MKSNDIYKLHVDHILICKQIGILPTEIPKLVTDRDEIHRLKLTGSRFLICRKTGDESIDKRTAGYGECLTFARTVFVDIRRHKYHRITYHGRKFNRFRKVEYVKARYKDFLHTLIEELVHYRFPYLQEGRELEKRIQEVFSGKEFPSKHIHLYALSRAKYRDALEGVNNQ
jgi:hypothetical protein